MNETPTPRTDAAKRTVTILSSRCGLARKEYDAGEIEYVCVEDMAKLEQELNEARLRYEVLLRNYNADTISLVASERDQLRKVVDELANTVESQDSTLGWKSTAMILHEKLPHVQEREMK